MRNTTARVLFMVGIALLVLAQITGVGYALYQWTNEIALGLALCNAFVIYAEMIDIGLLLLIISIATINL